MRKTIFITIAVAVLAIFVLDAIQSFDGGRVQDGIGSLLLGLLFLSNFFSGKNIYTITYNSDFKYVL